jgi:deoxyribodipyrimidine photo-lyase
VADNTGLTVAAAADRDDASGDATGRVLPVFVLDPDVLDHASPPRVAFLCDALGALREAYRDRGGDLLIARGDPGEELPRIADAHGADGVHWNRGYSGLARRRDDAVRDALEDVHGGGIAHETHDDALLQAPGSITTNDGDPYAVFSYFWTKWRDRDTEAPRDPPPDGALATPDDPGDRPTVAGLGFDPPEADVDPASPAAARDRLGAFLAEDVFDYDERRDYPADECTSRLSAHLRWGTIGVRTVHEAAIDAREDAPSADARESVETFRQELAWREFYHHVLYFNPETVTENYQSYEQPIAWRDDPDALQAWTDGETGYPIVDAGMRQLRREAYMHNRVRMIVASFLTKDLLIDWREGYDWFRRRLVDHNPANDVGGWQWAASTGTDAQPYFRIFNPTTQGERYDPDAEYIQEYVPELRDVSAKAIHKWPDLNPAERDHLAPDYPEPIVDHAERREAALAMFEAARGE